MTNHTQLAYIQTQTSHYVTRKEQKMVLFSIAFAVCRCQYCCYLVNNFVMSSERIEHFRCHSPITKPNKMKWCTVLQTWKQINRHTFESKHSILISRHMGWADVNFFFVIVWVCGWVCWCFVGQKCIHAHTFRSFDIFALMFDMLYQFCSAQMLYIKNITKIRPDLDILLFSVDAKKANSHSVCASFVCFFH